MKTTPDRWGIIETPFSTFAAWVDGEGRLTRFDLRAAGAASIDPDAIHDERAVDFVRRQVAEYCAGRRRVFDVTRAAAGTGFQHTVWEALMEIPYGETRSYGEIARRIGRPSAARAVGAANGANPIALIVPCHRVIGANGSLTGYAGGLKLKQALLAHEQGLSLGTVPAGDCPQDSSRSNKGTVPVGDSPCSLGTVPAGDCPPIGIAATVSSG